MAIPPDPIQTRSTSRRTADVNPLVLREGPQARLLFIPTLVDNVHDPSAAVRGVFTWQRRHKTDDWEPIANIPLTALKAGEAFKLELHSEEVLSLFVELEKLYRLVHDRGVPMGFREWTPVPAGSVVADVAQALGDPTQSDQRRELLHTFLRWLGQQDAAALLNQIQADGLSELLSFDAAIGAARLRLFVSQAEGMLDNGQESVWQAWLESQSWAVSQLFAHPFVIVTGQGYMGGKRVTGEGGNLVDFLYRNHLTHNALLVEIKTPLTQLVTARPYRNNVHGATEALAGAVSQVLQDRQSLVETYRSRLGDDDSPEVRAWNPRALLMVGHLRSLTSVAQRQSFELLRASLKDIDLVTFDELLQKANALLQTLHNA